MKRLTLPNVGEGVEQLELSHATVRNIKWYSRVEKWFGSFLKVLHIYLPYKPGYS